MDEENEDQGGAPEADPWAAAFAAIDQANEEGAEAASDASGAEQHDESAAGADGNQSAAEPVEGDGAGDEGLPGAPARDLGADGGEDGAAGEDVLGVAEDEVSAYRNQLIERIRDRAVVDVAKAFASKGIRNTNGKLGASINDADICKYDDDKVPHFYNPDTGHEFTGDNPRRQAQEWVDDYNKELAAAFNDACRKYSDKLMADEKPSLDVLEFASTYEALDPIRKSMMDSILEDYEIVRDGELVGYSCDLNKMLSLVNRQVAKIQEHGKASGAQAVQPSGPALDMKNSAAAVSHGNAGAPKSLAEALEQQQDALLAKARSK